MSNRIISEILEEPDAYFLLQEAQAVLNREREKRIAFYNEITEQEKAEFINGEIIVHSPVMKRHNRATLLLAQLLNVYSAKNQLGFVGIEKIMVSLSRNDYEPDVCFFRKEKADAFHEKQTLFPSPDFVVEVLSESTKDRDTGIKFKDYQAHGIEEYWIIDPDEESITQYHLENGQYRLVAKVTEGTLKCFVMNGLTVPVEAVFDETKNVLALQKLV